MFGPEQGHVWVPRTRFDSLWEHSTWRFRLCFVSCFKHSVLGAESTGLGCRPVSLVSGRGPRKLEAGRNHPDPLPRSFGFLHTNLLSDFDQIRMLTLGLFPRSSVGTTSMLAPIGLPLMQKHSRPGISREESQLSCSDPGGPPFEHE